MVIIAAMKVESFLFFSWLAQWFHSCCLDLLLKESHR